MILSDKEIIGIKDYAELIGKLRLIAKDCHWQLLEDAADAIDELMRDADRYRWLRDTKIKARKADMPRCEKSNYTSESITGTKK